MVLDLRKALENPAFLDERDDVEGALLRQLDEILQAETLEDAFGNMQATSARDLVGRPIVIERIALKSSSLESATGVYMLIHATDGESGDRLVVTTGAAKIMVQIAWAVEHDALPLAVRVVEIGAAKPGQSAPLGLELVKSEE